MNKKLALATGAVALITLTACEGESKQDAPEPTSSNIINGTNTQVIRMPNGFRNVVFTCYGTSGLYVTSRGPYQSGSTTNGSGVSSLPSSIFVLANDPHCRNENYK